MPKYVTTITVYGEGSVSWYDNESPDGLLMYPIEWKNLAKIQIIIHNAAAKIGDSMTFMNSK